MRSEVGSLFDILTQEVQQLHPRIGKAVTWCALEPLGPVQIADVKLATQNQQAERWLPALKGRSGRVGPRPAARETLRSIGETRSTGTRLTQLASINRQLTSVEPN